MTGVSETFIEILCSMRKELLEGLGKDIPEGTDSETRDAMLGRAEDIEEQVVLPLKALIDDLMGFVEELSTKAADVVSCAHEAGNASDEYDEATNAVQDFEGDDESDEFANLQDEETNAESQMTDADSDLEVARDEMVEAIDTLVAHIGEVKSAGEGE